MIDIDALNAMSADELARRLSPGSDDRVAIVRVAAEGGIVQAQIVLGQMLLDGHDLPADPRGAFGWFNRAAAQHDMFALNMVGRCYELGWGTAVDMTRAAHCYRVAAEQGLPEAMYNHATRLTLGEGAAQDRAAALDWFRRVASADAGLIGAKAENYIGSFLEDGWVVARDRDAAMQHYRRAAQGGDFRGQFNLARLLIEDDDLPGALPWLEKAGAGATDGFLEQAVAYLRRASDARVRDDGVDALLRGRSCD